MGFAGHLSNRSEKLRRPAKHFKFGLRFGTRTLLRTALRAGDWKIVRPKPSAPLELYHLGKDPKEAQNLAASEPQAFKRLSTLLAAARTEPRPLKSEGKAYWDEP